MRDDVVGRPHRYADSVGFPGVDLDESALVKHDVTTGSPRAVPLLPGCMPGETLFMPADSGTAEDDGYVLTVVSHPAADAPNSLSATPET